MLGAGTIQAEIRYTRLRHIDYGLVLLASFERADQIILEGMGTQFDSHLREYYEAARPKLEAYYAQG